MKRNDWIRGNAKAKSQDECMHHVERRGKGNDPEEFVRSPRKDAGIFPRGEIKRKANMF